MLSIGEIIDKLVIELIKADTVRQQMNECVATEDNPTYHKLYEKLTILNANRAVLKTELDSKIERVKNGEPNRVLKHCRTY